MSIDDRLPADGTDCTPEDSAPEDCAPENVALKDCTLEDIASQDCAPEDVTPKDVTPEGVSREDVDTVSSLTAENARNTAVPHSIVIDVTCGCERGPSYEEEPLPYEEYRKNATTEAEWGERHWG